MKNFYLVLILIIFLSPAAESQEADSSGIIKLKVDLDKVTLQVNNEIVDSDSYGNPLLPNAWFILNRPRGDYEVRFQREGYNPIETRISVLPREVSMFDARFLIAEEDTEETISGNATLNLISDPDSAEIIIEKSKDTVFTPATLNMMTGDHSFRAVADGYDDLVHNMVLEPDKIISLKFIMALSQPTGLTAEDLDLEYKPTIPLKEEGEAAKQREMFNNLAETFALIPLGQGILARLLLGDETEPGASILIATGATLTAGAYILGRIFPKRKLAKIQEYNQEATRINSEAKYHNKEIDSEVEEKNGELLENWMLQNQDRGKVETTIE